MSDLTKLPNIGKELARQLEMVDITTIDELINVGSENAFLRIKAIDPSACHNRLYALEGAIQGIRWHNLTEQRKQEMKEFFRMSHND